MVSAFGATTAEVRRPGATEARNENKGTDTQTDIVRPLSYVWRRRREAVHSDCGRHAKQTTQKPETLGC
jgi:hypothetical protein